MYKDTQNNTVKKLKRYLTSRIFPLVLIVFALFSLLIGRIYVLQIIEGASKQEEYISQKTKRTIQLSSTRGIIYDRNGNELASNRLVFVANITDDGSYSDGYQKNQMLLSLIEILDRHNEQLNEYVPIIIDRYGEFQFNCSEGRKLRFILDMYGEQTKEKAIEKKYDLNISAKGAFDLLYKRYGVGYKRARSKETYEIDDTTALKLINLRFGMAQHGYIRYIPTAAATDIAQETIADIMEHSDKLLGVSVDEDYIRVYNEPYVFAQLLGYTGEISQEQIDKFNKEAGRERYMRGDIVGQSGLESVLEQDLQGEKGSQTMYLDSLGHILEVTEKTDPESGNNYYLSVDRDLSVAAYHLMEQKLAGIILSKLTDGKVRITASMNNAERKISCYSVYGQFIGNSLLNTQDFAAAPEGSAQARISAAFSSGQELLINRVRAELLSSAPRPYSELDAGRDDQETFMQSYMDAVFRLLTDSGYLKVTEDIRRDDKYSAYKNDGTIGLGEFLRHAITKGWIDTSELSLNSAFASTNEAYGSLVAKLLELCAKDSEFTKTVYRNLLWDGAINPCDLCLAMLEQGVLESGNRAALETGAPEAAFEFIKEHIKNLTLTPAMMALDPCTAAVTVIDTDTGKVLACVAYPGYDNNRMSGKVDSVYFNKLNQDQSNPFYSAATQVQTAPGSVFKPCTALAALNSGVVEADEPVETYGVYSRYGLKMACWIYSTLGVSHGTEVLPNALRDSCNYFFSVMGERLSTKSGSYSAEGGLSLLNQYAQELGLGSKTGIELIENEPHLSDTSPIPSAIGQGTYLFSNVQLARYVTTLANRGGVFRLSLLLRQTDTSGITLSDFNQGLYVGKADCSGDSWDAVLTGMHKVVQEGTVRSYFTGNIDVAGKTGSAEENKLRPNHANFISFAPFDDPEISVTVTIPYGYTSANAVDIASSVYEYRYGFLPMEDILAAGAMVRDTYVDD